MKKLKMAVVGPYVLVHDIIQVAERFEELEIVPITYVSELESPHLIEQCKEMVDLFMFSGPVPYSLSQQKIPPNAKSFYIPFEGTDLYSVLLRVYQSYHFFPIVSYDIIPAYHLNEVYSELGISDTTWFVKSLEGYWDSQELLDHHATLWKERKVQVVATCLNSVYERLLKMKIPVFLIRHTKQTIRETISKAVLSGLEQRKSETQITILQFQVHGVDFNQPDQHIDDVKHTIVDYGNALLSGTSIVQEDKITLYTTRGLLDKVTKQGSDMHILHELRDVTAHPVHLGIGIGETADSASYNADRALQFAIDYGDSCCFLIDDQKQVQGPLGMKVSLQYSLIHQEEGGFGSLSLRKFYAWLTMMKKQQVTAREMSIGMNTSDRHASRILKQLCDLGLATVIGKESMNQKGRPRPIYEVNVAKLAQEV